MPSGLQALLALFLLLPGFVTARIVRLLTARSQQSDLERVVQALIYSFLIYVLYLGVFGAALPIDWVSTTRSDGTHLNFLVYRWRVCLLGITSVALGCVWGWIKANDWHMDMLRKVGITERTSRESVWNDVLISQEGVVQVGLGDGRIALGLLDRYSDTGEEGSLFLTKASWVAEDGTLTPIYGPGLLLTKSADIKFVMFLDEKLQQKAAPDRSDDESSYERNAPLRGLPICPAPAVPHLRSPLFSRFCFFPHAVSRTRLCHTPCTSRPWLPLPRH